MKLPLIFGAVVLAGVATAVYSACGGQSCRGISELRFLQANTEASDMQDQYRKLLNDPRFAKVDAFGVSGFIDDRKECDNFKRAAQSLSLLPNNVTDVRSRESKVEAILIYQEARRHGCNID